VGKHSNRVPTECPSEPQGGPPMGPYLGGSLLYGGTPPMGIWTGHPWRP